MRTPLPNTASSSRRSSAALAGRRRDAALLATLALAAVAGTAQAIGLGEISAQSGLGRPLRIVVPIIAAPGEEISGECFKLALTQRSADGIPEVQTARIALERTGAEARLVVTTLRPLNDPIVKVTLQAGCDSPVRREYTLLLDPLPIDTPVASEAPAPAAAVSPSAGTPATGDADARSTSSAPPPARTPRAPDRRRATAAGSATAVPAEPRPRAAAAPNPAARAAAAAPPQPKPKLTVSTAVPGGAPGKGAGDATAREQQELANLLEAETIVLRQRVVELAATVDRMQQEIVAAQALQAARTAAEEAAKTSPQATIGRWWSDGWPVLAAVIGLALLIAAGLSLRRRRSVADTPVWMRNAAPGEQAPARPAARPPAGAPAAARAVAQAAQARQGPDTRGQSTAVAVSELSHVTEEAGVYLAFNRMDRAIEVLQQHIRTAGSLPAAWVMLLDLYHKQGRDQDFRELAQDFHLRFNAAVPAWENFPPHDDGDRGLEAFPHIIRQVVSSWGTAECRALLDRLLHDNRDGRRTGFSLPAYEEILFLRQLAEQLSGDASATGAARRVERPAAAAGTTTATATMVASRLPRALDLELELDKDMLDSAKASRPAGTPPKPGKP
jgi:hypothetical protein